MALPRAVAGIRLALNGTELDMAGQTVSTGGLEGFSPGLLSDSSVGGTSCLGGSGAVAVLTTRLVCRSTSLGFLAGSDFTGSGFDAGSLTGSGMEPGSGGSAISGSGNDVGRTVIGIWRNATESIGLGLFFTAHAQGIANAKASALPCSNRLNLNPARLVISLFVMIQAG